MLTPAIVPPVPEAQINPSIFPSVWCVWIISFNLSGFKVLSQLSPTSASIISTFAFCVVSFSKNIILVPEYLAKNIASQTNVKIISWKGRCEVHERFTAKEILSYKEQHENIVVLAHPECSPEVVAVSDFTGSTAGMSNYVKDNQPEKVIMVTECSMSDNVAIENPNVDFVRPCNLSPHMKRISLKKIYDAIRFNQHEIVVEENIINKARLAIDRMLEIGRK